MFISERQNEDIKGKMEHKINMHYFDFLLQYVNFNKVQRGENLTFSKDVIYNWNARCLSYVINCQVNTNIKINFMISSGSTGNKAKQFEGF